MNIDIPHKALVVGAHPDDAEFGCAGTVAKWTRAGCEIHYLMLTSGDKGSEDLEADLVELRQIREQEQLEAAKLLGVAGCTFLHLSDGEVVNNLELRGLIVREIRRFKPEVIFTWDPLTRLYRMHPDHRACGQATLDAAFPAAMMPHSYPEHLRKEGLSVHRTKRLLLFGTDDPDYVSDISQTLELKFEAMGKHPSQFSIDNPAFIERMTKRAQNAAKEQPFEFGEGFKLVQLET
ncbi:PIG-L deacetylase family protein [Candidatus Chlorohelix sp.]|uniref:PIG-L deacetylase family protein n=1 Tax=Candidatus Chlorohelix sp. TaxID=3139201 RepID=UPI003030DFCD